MFEFPCLISFRCRSDQVSYSKNRKVGAIYQRMDRQMVGCATDERGETDVPHLQWHARSNEIIQRNEAVGLRNNARGTILGKAPARVCGKKTKVVRL